MRILLLQPFKYLYRWGGACKANRMLIRALGAAGHTCRVVTTHPAGEPGGPNVIERGRTEVGVVFDDAGTEVHGVTHGLTVASKKLTERLIALELETFRPDVVLVSEDILTLTAKPVMLRWLRALTDLGFPARIFVCQTTATLPFGPGSFAADEADSGAALLRQCRAVITMSEHVSATVTAATGKEAIALRFPAYGTPPFARLGRWQNPYVTYVNPSPLKGLPLFLQLAEALPNVQFAAVPTWATTARDLVALRACSNVEVLQPFDDVDGLFAQSRAHLVPSLWDEAFGMIVVDAMLRGVPVLASRIGGLPEAKLGVDHVLPVNPIVRYTPAVERGLPPSAIVPPQDVGPWVKALRSLLENEGAWEECARRSEAAAAAWVGGIRLEPFEALFQQVRGRA